MATHDPAIWSVEHVGQGRAVLFDARQWYMAVLTLQDGKVHAQLTRAKGVGAHEPYAGTVEDMEALEKRSRMRMRLEALFYHYGPAQLAILSHAYTGLHSALCPSGCALPVWLVYPRLTGQAA